MLYLNNRIVSVLRQSAENKDNHFITQCLNEKLCYKFSLAIKRVIGPLLFIKYVEPHSCWSVKADMLN
jgi:hypothetical protein